MEKLITLKEEVDFQFNEKITEFIVKENVMGFKAVLTEYESFTQRFMSLRENLVPFDIMRVWITYNSVLDEVSLREVHEECPDDIETFIRLKLVKFRVRLQQYDGEHEHPESDVANFLTREYFNCSDEI